MPTNTKTLYQNYIVEEFRIQKEPFYIPVNDEVQIFEAAYQSKIPILFKSSAHDLRVDRTLIASDGNSTNTSCLNFPYLLRLSYNIFDEILTATVATRGAPGHRLKPGTSSS